MTASKKTTAKSTAADVSIKAIADDKGIAPKAFRRQLRAAAKKFGLPQVHNGRYKVCKTGDKVHQLYMAIADGTLTDEQVKKDFKGVELQHPIEAS